MNTDTPIPLEDIFAYLQKHKIDLLLHGFYGSGGHFSHSARVSWGGSFAPEFSVSVEGATLPAALRKAYEVAKSYVDNAKPPPKHETRFDGLEVSRVPQKRGLFGW